MESASSRSSSVLVLATLNGAKAGELEALLAGVPFRLIRFGSISGAALPQETGSTYAENALLKARAVVQMMGTLALGDDSGLEVDALGGAPGVRSARYGGPGKSDAERTALLLDSLRGVPRSDRTARFRCVIAVVEPTGRERLASGVVEGLIAEAPRGTGGFGYDPVFVLPALGRTMAELSEAEKRQISHRAVAVRAVRRLLSE